MSGTPSAALAAVPAEELEAYTKEIRTSLLEEVWLINVFMPEDIAERYVKVLDGIAERHGIAKSE